MPVWKVLTTTGLQAVLFTLLGWAIWIFSDRPGHAFITVDLWEFALGVGLAVGLICIAAIPAKLFPNYSEWLVRSQAKNYPFLNKGLSMPAIIFISMCAGIGEEALFRGGLQSAFSDYMPIALAIGLAAAAFAAIHFARALITLLIFVIGCMFGVAHWLSGSLCAVAVGHALYDIWAITSLQKAMQRLDPDQALDEMTLPRASADETIDITKV